MLKRVLIIFWGIFIFSSFAEQEEKIEAFKSAFYVGRSVMACGVVTEIVDLDKVHIINLDKKFPNQTLALVIFDNDYQKFLKKFYDLESLIEERVCARGIIEDYKDRLQIVIKNPQFLRLIKN